jgi:hypothetical protein
MCPILNQQMADIDPRFALRGLNNRRRNAIIQQMPPPKEEERVSWLILLLLPCTLLFALAFLAFVLYLLFKMPAVVQAANGWQWLELSNALLLTKIALSTVIVICSFSLCLQSHGVWKIKNLLRMFWTNFPGIVLIFAVMLMYCTTLGEFACHGEDNGATCRRILWNATFTAFPSQARMRGTRECKAFLQANFGQEHCPPSMMPEKMHFLQRLQHGRCNAKTCSEKPGEEGRPKTEKRKKTFAGVIYSYTTQNSSSEVPSSCDCKSVMEQQDAHNKCLAVTDNFFTEEISANKNLQIIGMWTSAAAVLASVAVFAVGVNDRCMSPWAVFTHVLCTEVPVEICPELIMEYIYDSIILSYPSLAA